jgi:hypothetical protein
MQHKDSKKNKYPSMYNIDIFFTKNDIFVCFLQLLIIHHKKRKY